MYFHQRLDCRRRRNSIHLLRFFRHADHVATSTIDKLVDYCMNTPADGLSSSASVETLKKLMNKNLQIMNNKIQHTMATLKEKIGWFRDMSSSMFWKIFSYYLPFFYSNILA